jgi:hypothetical protein
MICLTLITAQHIPAIITGDQDVKGCWKRIESYHKSYEKLGNQFRYTLFKDGKSIRNTFKALVN